uniref:Uncharacterized protein n=1 Tax=Anguilla anguilla TaxID=7936 RepID=A0A0E9SHM1_ANGAN
MFLEVLNNLTYWFLLKVCCLQTPNHTLYIFRLLRLWLL